jgi:hypothetical protein
MTKQDQIQKVAKILFKKGSITNNEAMFKMSPPIKRLGARIWDLRKQLKESKAKYSIKTFILNDRTAKYILEKN